MLKNVFEPVSHFMWLTWKPTFLWKFIFTKKYIIFYRSLCQSSICCCKRRAISPNFVYDSHEKNDSSSRCNFQWSYRNFDDFSKWFWIVGQLFQFLHVDFSHCNLLCNNYTEENDADREIPKIIQSSNFPPVFNFDYWVLSYLGTIFKYEGKLITQITCPKQLSWIVFLKGRYFLLRLSHEPMTASDFL
jgi:hypothetical protein